MKLCNVKALRMMQGLLMSLTCMVLLAGRVMAGPGLQKLNTTRISIDFNKEKLDQALNKVIMTSRISFAFNPDEVKEHNVGQFRFKNETVANILDKVLKDLPFSYKENNATVVVFYDPARLTKNMPPDRTADVASPVMIDLSPVLPGVQQAVTVTGRVYSKSDNTALPGATIKEAGTSNGATTDANGNFSIRVKDLQASLEVTMIGFLKQTIKLNGSSNVTIRLDVNSEQLKDVVIIGYQETERRNTTAAVTTVKGREVENLPAASVDMLLQGRVPGLNVQINNGAPGSSPVFSIRGNASLTTNIDNAKGMSSPLFVIDGIPTTIEDMSAFDNTGTNFLAGLNPNDIEAIDVLKDAAAAAVYGSRGANGVVLIKTKKGRMGKPQVTFNSYLGLTERPMLQETVLGAEERQMKMSWLDYWGTDAQMKGLPMILTDSLNEAFNNATDWQDLFYREGLVQNYDFSVAGAKEGFNYRVSLNHYNEDGVIRATGYKRYSLLSNVGIDVTPKLKFTGLFRLNRSDRSVGRGTEPGQVLPLSGSGYDFPSSLLYVSDLDKANYTGEYDKAKNTNINDNLQTTLVLEFRPWKDLLLRSQVSGDFSSNRSDVFKPAELDEDGQAFAGSYNSFYQSFVLNTSANYSSDFQSKGKHRLSLVLAQEIQRIKNNTSQLQGYGVPSDNITTVSGISTNKLSGYSDEQEAGLLSYLFQGSYSFMDKYLLSTAFRADASSRFGANYRWAYFPSVSLGWIVSEEPWMQSLQPVLPFVKLRGSYGMSGNQPSDYYLSYNTYSVNQGGYGGTTIPSYNGVVAVTPNYSNGVAQPDLSWEKQKELNLGFELGVLPQNRLYITFDYYYRDRSNILLSRLLPNTTGYDEVKSNSAGVLNKGLELQIRSRNLNPKGKFQWNTTLNVAFNKNMVTYLPDGDRDLKMNSNYILSVGAPLYTYYMVKSNGVYSSAKDIPVNPYTGSNIAHWYSNYIARPGWFNWADLDGDFLVWEWNDRRKMGNPQPKVTGGFINDFSYGPFTASINTSFTLGRDIFNTYISEQLDNLKQLGNLYGSQIPDLWNLDTWQKDGDKATYASLNPYDTYYYQFYPNSTAFLENGSYVKINNITLGYQLSKNLLNRLKLSKVGVYGVMDNVYTFKKSNVPNPELVDAYGRYNGNSYPTPRKYTLGLNVTF